MSEASIGPVSEWTETLESRRNWVKGWIPDEATAAQFDTDPRVKMNILIAVAEELELDNTPAWQALGIVFGDALSLVTGLPWGEITDEYGTDPCLVANAAKNAVVFPMTMLSKRAEQGQRPDRETILNLFQQAANQAQELAAQAQG
ncbi:MAG: DUF3806 domain-containing protein [Bifidobacteriaceae bacterium]|jgi:hypothetical protein|nr:DUF3806 domain-containing protein [Bifidobacteriaceae bacterium]